MYACRLSATRVFIFLFSLLLGRGISSAQCYPETYGANAFDYNPDSQAIQACLDQGGTTVLTYNPNGGYFIDVSLNLTLSNTVLTSATGDRARVIAANNLWGPILRTASVSGYEISNVEFNGNKFLRDYRWSCSGYRDYGTNLQLRGSGFNVHHIDSTRAMCGSGMEVDGASFEIHHNWIGYNGRSVDDGMPGDPWSDGITLLRCEGGSVYENDLENNTDVDLVVGGGHNCSVVSNHVRHTPTRGVAVYGFAGIHIGYFDTAGGDNAGSTIGYNDVTSDLDKLGFGIIVGYHPWGGTWVVDAGNVVGNTTTGSVVPLAVDGILNGVVQSNSAWGHRGVKGFHCGLSDDYTAGDFGNASIQGGWIWRTYHNGSCQ